MLKRSMSRHVNLEPLRSILQIRGEIGAPFLVTTSFLKWYALYDFNNKGSWGWKVVGILRTVQIWNICLNRIAQENFFLTLPNVS